MILNNNPVAAPNSFSARRLIIISSFFTRTGQRLPLGWYIVKLAFRFGPLAGVPKVATRVRLATSQTVTAVAVFADGSCWKDEVAVLVTWSACLD